MALIKSIEELKKYVAVSASLELKTILPDIIWAEEKYILPYIGKAMYDHLHTAYTAATTESPLEAKLQVLLNQIQKALFNLAYAKSLPLAQVNISNAGIRIQTDEKNKQAFEWQISQLEDYFLSKGFEYLEGLLLFLELSATDYPAWKDSEAYTVNKKYFINSAADFSALYNISNSRATYLALLPILQRVEELVLIDLLSEGFYEGLKAEIATGTISAETKKLLRYLQPALANLAIAEAILELALEVSPSGIRLNLIASTTGKVKAAPSEVLLAAKKDQAKKTGREYLARLESYLKASASETTYKTYYENVILPSKAKTADSSASGNIYGAF